MANLKVLPAKFLIETDDSAFCVAHILNLCYPFFMLDELGRVDVCGY